MECLLHALYIQITVTSRDYKMNEIQFCPQKLIFERTRQVKYANKRNKKCIVKERSSCIPNL